MTAASAILPVTLVVHYSILPLVLGLGASFALLLLLAVLLGEALLPLRFALLLVALGLGADLLGIQALPG